MQVKVYEDRNIEIINNPGTQNENEAEVIQIKLPEKYEDYNKKIVFILPEQENNIVWDFIENNEYIIRKNITKYPKVSFYIWLTKGEQDFRTVTTSLSFRYNEDASNEITEEEIGAINQLLEKLEIEIEKVDNLDIDIGKENHTATITLTRKDGTQKQVQILDGEKGDKGEPGYTPQRGVDYWTSEDIADIDSSIEMKLATYFNKPFVSFRLQNGNLIAEVEEYGNNN